jgi:hypothetical protein
VGGSIDRLGQGRGRLGERDGWLGRSAWAWTVGLGVGTWGGSAGRGRQGSSVGQGCGGGWDASEGVAQVIDRCV